ncbi:MAG: PLP-dependent transferase, partial [Ferroplasma sp.]
MIKDNIKDIYAAPLTFPIYQTSSYIVPQGIKYRYTREYNPTVENLAMKIKKIENAEASNVFSSGMGAITTALLSLVNPGDRIL